MAWSRYKKSRPRVRARKKIYRRKAYRVKRRVLKKYRKPRSVPYGFPSAHVAMCVWSAAVTVDMSSLQTAIVHTFNLRNPWAPDQNAVTSGAAFKASALSDILTYYREATVLKCSVIVDQEVNYTTNRVLPLYAFLRKKLGNSGVNADSISNADEMYREVNPRGIRTWGEVNSAWGTLAQGKYSKARPMWMNYSTRKDSKIDPWDPDNQCTLGVPNYTAYCHLHMINYIGGGDPQACRYRITMKYMVAFRGRRDGVSQ